MKDAKESAGVEPGTKASPLEEQYVLEEYGVLQGTLNDYAGIVIQYGYTVLFVAAFSLAPTMAFVSSFVQLRIDAWKLCQAHRRPQPKTAEDIGVWQDMLEIISVLSVVFNFALLFFTSTYLKDVTWEFRWIMFIIVEHACFILKFVLSVIIDDVPEEVQMQLDRFVFHFSLTLFVNVFAYLFNHTHFLTLSHSFLPSLSFSYVGKVI